MRAKRERGRHTLLTSFPSNLQCMASTNRRLGQVPEPVPSEPYPTLTTQPCSRYRTNRWIPTSVCFPSRGSTTTLARCSSGSPKEAERPTSLVGEPRSPPPPPLLLDFAPAPASVASARSLCRSAAAMSTALYRSSSATRSASISAASAGALLRAALCGDHGAEGDPPSEPESECSGALPSGLSKLPFLERLLPIPTAASTASSMCGMMPRSTAIDADAHRCARSAENPPRATTALSTSLASEEGGE